jgi:hypothetical protein
MTNKVKKVDTVKPPITVIAKGDQRLEDSLLSKAMGTSPKMVVREVIIIGLSLS